MGEHDRDENPEADSRLTPAQTELLDKLEGLFRELPLARQRLLIRKLRADSGDDQPCGAGDFTTR